MSKYLVPGCRCVHKLWSILLKRRIALQVKEGLIAQKTLERREQRKQQWRLVRRSEKSLIRGAVCLAAVLFFVKLGMHHTAALKLRHFISFNVGFRLFSFEIYFLFSPLTE